LLETLPLIGAEPLADLLPQVLLLAIELLPNVVLEAFDPIAAGAQHAADFLALRGIEIQIRRQPPQQDFRRRPATASRWTRGVG
jgi:hypothetical protein